MLDVLSWGSPSGPGGDELGVKTSKLQVFPNSNLKQVTYLDGINLLRSCCVTASPLRPSQRPGRVMSTFSFERWLFCEGRISACSDLVKVDEVSDFNQYMR